MAPNIKTAIFELVVAVSHLREVCAAVVTDASAKEIDWAAYEQGKHGPRPMVEYHSSSAKNPLIHTTAQNPACETDSFVLLSPRGNNYPGNKAHIYDQDGSLVWQHEEQGAISSLQVQSYKDARYLTYWVGDDNFWAHGSGYYKMLDRNYDLAYAIRAGNGLDGDYHEFSITQDDTALITAFVKTPWDLSAYGRDDGFIWDCAFQEVDIETGNVFYEWRASQHFTFDELMTNSWAEWTGTNDDPWDWFHLNSVDKDARGNYLITTRYTNAVSYINGRTGDVIWNMGGKQNDFTDLAEGNATHFADAHMARWVDNDTAITLFDNVAYGSEAPQSRGLKIVPDAEKKIVRVEAVMTHPERLAASSEGSMQILDIGNYFLGYGSNPAYAEFAPNGTLLCSAHYAPLNRKDDSATPGGLGSYRVSKHKWVGYPDNPPDVKVEEDGLWVSWNGATELRSWRLAGRETDGDGWRDLSISKRTGFETLLTTQTGSYAAFQLSALNVHGDQLSAWILRDDGTITELYREASLYRRRGFMRRPKLLLRSVLWVTLVTSCLLLLILNRRLLIGR